MSLPPKRFLTVAASVIGLAMPASGQDFDAGLNAAERGDYAAALKEWRPLAHQGQADAQYHLAVLYDSGMGIPEDDAQAVAWYQRAAEQGHRMAQYNLALAYDNGAGVPVDHVYAIVWYRRAAAQGHSGAQYSLGVSYDIGEGQPQDNAKAAEWLCLESRGNLRMA